MVKSLTNVESFDRSAAFFAKRALQSTFDFKSLTYADKVDFDSSKIEIK